MVKVKDEPALPIGAAPGSIGVSSLILVGCWRMKEEPASWIADTDRAIGGMDKEKQ